MTKGHHNPMATMEKLEWVPGSPVAVINRASDALDVDLADVAGDVLDAAGDIVEAAGEGIVAAIAATEVASEATVKLLRRHPLLVAAVAAGLIAGVVLLLGKRRKRAAGDTERSLHVAA